MFAPSRALILLIIPSKKSINRANEKQTQTSWPFPKLIFCHQWSLLDWTRMIKALFGMTWHSCYCQIMHDLFAVGGPPLIVAFEGKRQLGSPTDMHLEEVGWGTWGGKRLLWSKTTPNSIYLLLLLHETVVIFIIALFDERSARSALGAGNQWMICMHALVWWEVHRLSVSRQFYYLILQHCTYVIFVNFGAPAPHDFGL